MLAVVSLYHNVEAQNFEQVNEIDTLSKIYSTVASLLLKTLKTLTTTKHLETLAGKDMV